MKVLRVSANARKNAFEVRTRDQSLQFPFAAVQPTASKEDPVASVDVDPEIGDEGFTYTLRSGAQGTVHVDHVLEYNRDPAYMSRHMVYELTLLAEQAVAASPLSTRELIRRLGTSASQFYRLLDPANSTKSLTQLLELLAILDCDIDLAMKYGSRSNRQESRLRFSPIAPAGPGTPRKSGIVRRRRSRPSRARSSRP